jgi:hypothetical protein
MAAVLARVAVPPVLITPVVQPGSDDDFILRDLSRSEQALANNPG